MQPQQPQDSKKTLIAGLIVIAVIFAGVAVAYFVTKKGKVEDGTSSVQSTGSVTADDVTRKTRINSIYSKLEEYYNNNGVYPATIEASTLTGIDAQALTDLNGKPIRVIKVDTDVDASAVSKTTAQDQMQYIPYNCDTSGCQKYLLRGFIASKSGTYVNPYQKQSLN